MLAGIFMTQPMTSSVETPTQAKSACSFTERTCASLVAIEVLM